MSKNFLPKIVIDLSAIVNNYNLIKSNIFPTKVSCVLKANAYGVGVEQVSKAIYENTDCDTFFVAYVSEGIELRGYIGPEPTIYILHGAFKEEFQLLKEYNLIPVLNNLQQISEFAQYSNTNRCVLHFDTGMNRLGIEPSNLEKAIKLIEKSNLNIDYIMSHLAASEDHDNPSNKNQLEVMEYVISKFPNTKKSFSNSAGTYLGKNFLFDMVRCGKGLYGPDKALNLNDPGLKRAVYIYGLILQIRTIEEDTGIGYSHTYIAKQGSKIATVNIGYADGYLRCLGNKAKCYVNGYYANVVGKVSMDMITIDVTHIPEHLLYIGMEVEILGDHVSNDEILIASGTSSYELFTRLGSRFIREYIHVNKEATKKILGAV